MILLPLFQSFMTFLGGLMGKLLCPETKIGHISAISRDCGLVYSLLVVCCQVGAEGLGCNRSCFRFSSLTSSSLWSWLLILI